MKEYDLSMKRGDHQYSQEEDASQLWKMWLLEKGNDHKRQWRILASLSGNGLRGAKIVNNGFEKINFQARKKLKSKENVV